MGVVLLQILQWILRIILFLLILLLVLGTIVLIVPIRYRAEWDYLEKKPGVRGRITWFFYLIYMRFYYEEEFRMQVKVCGFKVFDSMDGEKKPKKEKKTESKGPETSVETAENKPEIAKNEISETVVDIKTDTQADELAVWEKEMEEEAKEEAELAKQIKERESKKSAQSSLQDGAPDWNYSEEVKANSEDTSSEKCKKTISEKLDEIKIKIQELLQKLKNIIAKIQDEKLKIEHYLELWNRDETQITFGRAKTKFGRMIKAVLPGKWQVTGEVGFSDPCTTGQFMGVLGAMYPIVGNRVRIVADFENEVLDVKGHFKGHIRLGNMLYQLVSLLLNRHCFKFIKLVFDEFGGSKKGEKKQKVQKQ